MTINWRIGIEIELLAPLGKSRLDLANAIAQFHNGTVRRFFHPQSEPSKVPSTPIFHNLTLGYEILDDRQECIAQCVDDLTLQADLIRKSVPKPGWYRIISDDERLLRLIGRQADPSQPLQTVLNPIGDLFGTATHSGPGGMVGLNDEMGASVAIAAPLPGERERPCELITAPLESNHQEQLESLLSLARSLGFTAPVEGATHIHFDASRLQSADAIANLIQLLWTYGEALKQLMGTNPNCRRLGQWPDALLETIASPDFRSLAWPEAQSRLQQVDLTKYCDFNLVNYIRNIPNKNTIEIRILPVWLESQPLLEAAALFAAILERSVESPPILTASVQKDTQATIKTLLEMLPLSAIQQDYWRREI
ncbi:MAG: amidoligase family protein [Thermosynechococcaceae cyanobacterium]